MNFFSNLSFKKLSWDDLCTHKYRFHNGGLIFSTTLLAVIAVISLYSFLLLVETRNKVPMSFGDIGGVLFGQTMRMAVLFYITISQVIFFFFFFFFLLYGIKINGGGMN